MKISELLRIKTSMMLKKQRRSKTRGKNKRTKRVAS